MNSTTYDAADESGLPLALHVRRRRQWHAERGMSQDELAHLAALQPRVIRRYETCRRLAPTIHNLVVIARVLGMSVEDLIAPEILDEIDDQIAQRAAGAPIASAPAEPDDAGGSDET